MTTLAPPHASRPLKTTLTIASSDSGAGAGIQADLKTFAANGVYGTCVISAVTAQNTTAVLAMECLPPTLVEAQLKAVFDDFSVTAVKIGLLGNQANTDIVASFLSQLKPRPLVVLDPVMISTSGHSFLSPDSIEALKRLMGLAVLTTPNLPEAEALSGQKINTPADRHLAATRLLELGAQNVLIKGGHSHTQNADDYLLGPMGETWFSAPKIDTPNTHGTGCTLSSAICANLALGHDLATAVAKSKHYVSEGLKHSLNPGHGAGPLHHFHQYYFFDEATND